MNPYLAIARRDFKRSRGFFIYVAVTLVLALSNILQQMSFYYVVYLLSILLIYCSLQLTMMKASYAHRAGFTLPNFRHIQFKYSVITIALFTLLVTTLLVSTFAIGMAVFGGMLTIEYLLFASFSKRVSKHLKSPMATTIAIFLSVSFVLLAFSIDLDELYKTLGLWAKQNTGLTVLIGAVLIASACGLIPWLHWLANQAQELTPDDMPHFWKNKNKQNSNSELVKQFGYFSKWLSKTNLFEWQLYLGLIGRNSLVDKGLFGGALTSSALAILSLVSIVVLLFSVIVNIVAQQFGHGISLHQEGVGLLFGAGLTLCSLLINITLCAESVSMKNLMVKLLMLDISQNRNKAMGRLYNSISLRFVRFYLFFTLAFIAMALLTGASPTGILLMLSMAAPSLLLLPIIMAYNFWAIVNMHYSVMTRVKVFTSILLIMVTGYVLILANNWLSILVALFSITIYMVKGFTWRRDVLEIG